MTSSHGDTSAVSRAAQRELDLAGITAPDLRLAYLECRRLNARHGRTYYLATLLLPAAKRPAVHALYGFARWVDDVVDEGTGPTSVEAQAALIEQVRVLLERPSDADDPPVVTALRDTQQRWAIEPSYFTDFLDSMLMDLTVADYSTFAELEKYMWGSASVIGLQMLPVLHPIVPVSVAEPYAADLGVAFQLTNFLRDIADDLRRGRLYLPLESLHHHGVTRADLERGVVTGGIRRLLAAEIARAREYYRSAAAGIRLLHPTSRDCIRTALTLYGDILTEIEACDYRVLDQRVVVGLRRRLAVAAPHAARAWLARNH